MTMPFFILAPMDDVTDTVFRRIVADCAAPDFTVTEFVNVEALCSKGRDKVIRKLGVELDTTPVIAQIWGKGPENFETIAKEISDGVIPGFVGIDLNFGCPAKSELKNQCCSALQKPELRANALAIIKATQKGAAAGKNNLPVSFKTRLGFGEIDYTWHEFLLKQKPSMLTVHVRTTREMSKVPAHWDAIVPIVELRDKISPDTKIVMNGDIIDRDHGEHLADKYGLGGIMIGRGVFQDPFCFSSRPEHLETCEFKIANDEDDLRESCTCPSVWGGVSREERIAMLKNHIEMHDKMYPNAQRPFNPLKKFAKVYISDFPGAAELRNKIMQTESAEEALKLL